MQFWIVFDQFEGHWTWAIFNLLFKVNKVTGRLVSNIPAAQIICSTSKWYSWCILVMSYKNLMVSDTDLFLTYFSMSDRSLESLLVRYQLYKSSDQFQISTVDTCGECLRHVKRQWPSPFLPLNPLRLKGIVVAWASWRAADIGRRAASRTLWTR